MHRAEIQRHTGGWMRRSSQASIKIQGPCRGVCLNAGFQRSLLSEQTVRTDPQEPARSHCSRSSRSFTTDLVLVWTVFEMLQFRDLIPHHLLQLPDACFYTIYILCNVNVNRRKRKETFSDGCHVLLIPKGEPQGSQAEADQGASHAQSLLWGHYTM